MHSLFTPFQAGDIALANRIVMAPLTRNRALPGRIPGDLQVEYYRQRASAGLIVTEASQISPEGQGYLDTPGIHNDAQVAGWRRVTEAVHAAGGRIVIQLWHVGRISHVSLQPGGQSPVSSTARAAATKTFTKKGFEPVSAPRVVDRREVRHKRVQRDAGQRHGARAQRIVKARQRRHGLEAHELQSAQHLQLLDVFRQVAAGQVLLHQAIGADVADHVAQVLENPADPDVDRGLGAALLGGSLEAGPASDRGWRVRAVLPAKGSR